MGTMRQITTVLALSLALLGCSDYANEFEAEPLILYDVQIRGVTASSATIEWRTNKKADSKVFYKTAGGFEKTASDTTEVLDHRLELTDLDRRATYYVVLRSEVKDPPLVARVDGLSFETLE